MGKPDIVPLAMAVRLTIAERGDPSSTYERSFLQDRVLLGRARSSDVCLPDMAVSTRHAEIRVKQGGYTLVDLGSVNGTALNGKPLVAHRPRPLRSGDAIQIANFQITFAVGVATAGPEDRHQAIDHARQILAGMLSRAGVEQPDENRERSLAAIFDTPEEATSSYAASFMGAPDPVQVEAGGPFSGEMPLPPVGPRDPLLDRVAPTTDPPGGPEPPEPDRSDLGLIVIGGLIVIAAVASLVYLFA